MTNFFLEIFILLNIKNNKKYFEIQSKVKCFKLQSNYSKIFSGIVKASNYLLKMEGRANVQQKVLCNWGMTLQQSSAVHIQASYSADGILPGSSSKHRHLVINLTSVTGGQLVNSPTAQSPYRCALRETGLTTKYF